MTKIDTTIHHKKPIICLYCESPFQIKQRKNIDTEENKFCSPSCLYQYKNTEANKDLEKLPFWANHIYRTTKKASKKRGIAFTLTKDELLQVVKASDSKCQITGIKFDLSTKIEGPRRLYWPSIDRIDSSKSYEKGNVRLVCVCVNISINAWGSEMFFEIAAATVFYNKLNIYHKKNVIGGKLSRGISITESGKYRLIYANRHVGMYFSEAEAISAREKCIAASKEARLLKKLAVAS